MKLAQELKPLYPDAQIYLDLKGVDPHPLSVKEIMEYVVRSFHPETPVPSSEAQLAALYLSVLDGKRVLLLMDNAAGKEQVQPLLPPSDCLFLVTSRFHFALPGLVVRDLDELSKDDAKALLLKIAPRIGELADEIATCCGCLPLALRLAGSTLAERRDLVLSEYVRRLKEGKELGGVEASFDLSYRLLTEEQQRLWCMLAVFPGTFNKPAAAAVWGSEVDPATEILGDLVKRSLVEWEDADQRYRLHDLLREFAVRRLEESERDLAERRHSEYFLEILNAADNLYKAGGNSILPALQVFDAEWTNIHAGFAWAADHFANDSLAAQLCDDYPNVGAYLLDLRQHPRERIRWRELALAAARQQEDLERVGIHLNSLGNAYAVLGEPRRAIEYYEQDLTITRELGDRQGEGQTLGNLGIAYRGLDVPARAIEFFDQSLTIAREVGDRRAEGHALGNLGNTYAALGDPRRAIDLSEQRLKIARELGDRQGEGQTLGNLGVAYMGLDEPARAIEFFDQSLTIAREVGDRRVEGYALGNLGNAYAALGDPRRAIEFYEKNLTIAREVGERRGEGYALGNLGNAYLILGDPRRAIDLYGQRLKVAREVGDRRGESIASWNLGVVYEKEGNLAKAVDLMQICVDFEHEIGHPDKDKHAAYLASLRARLDEQKAKGA